MLGERVLSKSREWVSCHRGTLLKVAAGAGAVVVGALMVRRHEWARSGGLTAEEEATLGKVGVDLSPRRPGESFAGPGRSTPGGKLAEYLSPNHTGCVALLTADKQGLLEHASRLDGKIAAAYRKDDGAWTSHTIEDDHPAAKADPNEPARTQIGVSLQLGDGATEAALGVVTTDEQGDHFSPAETTLLGAGPAAMMGLTLSDAERPATFNTMLLPGNSQ